MTQTPPTPPSTRAGAGADDGLGVTARGGLGVDAGGGVAVAGRPVVDVGSGAGVAAIAAPGEGVLARLALVGAASAVDRGGIGDSTIGTERPHLREWVDRGW